MEADKKESDWSEDSGFIPPQRDLACILNGCIACDHERGWCEEHEKVGNLEARDIPYHCKRCGEYMEGEGKKNKGMFG